MRQFRMLAVILLTAFPVMAQDASIKINTEKVLAPADETACTASCPPLTVGRAIMHAMAWPNPDDRAMGKQERMAANRDRDLIAYKAMSSPGTGFTVVEIAIIKSLVTRFYVGGLDAEMAAALDPTLNPLCPFNQQGVRACP